ncbi:hypothetical protein RRG08_062312 [Elysia crispata]|uniref:Uncharacterized protein n=1 Tax=Elysia crispata TaxID=231223 RepID=A0AAE1CYX0_9GAST|nr:hypothetical protein RRG08_062312 [Elysia crispata]
MRVRMRVKRDDGEVGLAWLASHTALRIRYLAPGPVVCSLVQRQVGACGHGTGDSNPNRPAPALTNCLLPPALRLVFLCHVMFWGALRPGSIEPCEVMKVVMELSMACQTAVKLLSSLEPLALSSVLNPINTLMP